MLRRIPLVVLFVLFTQIIFAQLQSPGQFLGYALGSRYTPHWRIVEYYRHVAAAVPSMVKLQDYGKTYEGRQLLVAYVSTATNISALDRIRTNNLALMEKNSGDNSNAPAIVWLSYNVHGNETSSSESGMMMLYELVNPSNVRAKQWLQNTVVIIDPCLNPDGRDRYVNWFNSVTGKNYNPSMSAREHQEPWPGGRTNHYYFDLNRDWAWQTQVESQQRMVLYQQWMPQVHVDFHEQGVNNPYYFAPAAEPYHEVITKWQREFQHTIGRNHAKYFDEKGWLYFTREVFDLLYPSYGDTYPTYNGAIGMTYEQAGGPRGGAAALTQDGDTLTLLERIQHHYTTAMSTVEIASLHAQKLITEFRKFFSDASTNGSGEYKSYVIRYSKSDESKLQKLQEMLVRNGVVYNSGKAGTYRGMNYNSGKEESFTVQEKDILIPAAQKKGVLVNVLFEPNTRVVDSATYDITAWALPYVYGVQAWAVRQQIPSGSSTAKLQWNEIPAIPENSFAVVIPWKGTNSVKLTGQLLQKGIRLRVSERPFESGGNVFDRGSIIVLRSTNENVADLWKVVRELANSNKVEVTIVSSGFVDRGYDFGSSKVRSLKARNVALLTGAGINSNASGEVWHFFEEEIGYPLTLINADAMSQVRWSDFDVVILPDGDYRFLNDKSSAEAFRNWIQGGGHVIALEGAVAQLSKLEGMIRMKKADDPEKDPYSSLHKYENRERDFIPNITPGSIFRVELDNSHPLGFGYPGYYYTLKQDDRLYEFIVEDGWNVGILRKDRQVAGFVGSKLQNRLQDGLLFGVQDVGNGTITYLADNVLFRSFWENGKLMFANAVFLVGE